MKSIARSSALIALALAATVASTTYAFADGIDVTQSGQVGNPQNASSSSRPGTTGTSTLLPSVTATWANTNCSGTACGGNANGSVGYNFAYTSLGTTTTSGTALGGAQGDSASGNAGFVGMDANTLADSACLGCSMLALEADDYSRAAMDYTITGLTNGAHYTLTYDFAETQQSSATCDGNCTGNFEAQLGVTELMGGAITGSGTSVNVNGATINSQHFSGWDTETISFTASGTTEELSFLADSKLTSQVPGFALVDNFNLTGPAPSTTPEPSSLMLLGTGLAGLSGLLRSRFKKSAAAIV